MANEKIAALQKHIQDLQRQRETHEAAIREIDQAFRELGIEPESVGGSGTGSAAGAAGGVRKRRVGRPKKTARPGRVGRPPKAAPPARAGAGRPKKRQRGRFAVTGLESIENFVAQAGAAGRTGAEIDAHWHSEGRKDTSYNLLGQLVRSGRIKRNNIQGQRGSVYRVR